MSEDVIKTERLILRPWRDEDFDHSKLSEGNKLRRHVLYRIEAKDYFILS